MELIKSEFSRVTNVTASFARTSGVHLSSFFSACFTSIFVKPFYDLYRDGPRILGCWQGASNAQICAYDTNLESHYWNNPQNEELCYSIVHTRFNSYVVLVKSGVIALFIYEGIRTIVFRLCVWRYVMRDIERTVRIFNNRQLAYDTVK
jgi:hypothetical protein